MLFCYSFNIFCAIEIQIDEKTNYQPIYLAPQHKNPMLKGAVEY